MVGPTRSDALGDSNIPTPVPSTDKIGKLQNHQVKPDKNPHPSIPNPQQGTSITKNEADLKTRKLKPSRDFEEFDKSSQLTEKYLNSGQKITPLNSFTLVHYVSSEEANSAINRENEEDVLEQLQPEEWEAITQLIETVDVTEPQMKGISENLDHLFNRLTLDQQERVVESIIDLSKEREDILMQLIHTVSVSTAVLFLKVILPPSLFREALDPPSMDEGSPQISSLKLFLTRAGEEPIGPHAQMEQRFFDSLPSGVKTHILSNIGKALNSLSETIHKDNKKLFSPLDMVKLFWLANHVKRLYENAPQLEAQKNQIFQQIVDCQSKILESQPENRLFFFAHLTEEWSLMDTLKQQSFSTAYTHILERAPKLLSHDKVSPYTRSWYTYQEQLSYLVDRSYQMLQKANNEQVPSLNHIIERSQKRIQKIQSGQDVKMPVLYHGIRRFDAAKPILNTSMRSSDAFNGPGTYVSNEMERGYGPYFFALDRRGLNSEKTVLNNLAYFVVPGEEEVGRVKKFLKETAPSEEIEVITSKEAELEHRMLQELSGSYDSKQQNQIWQKAAKELELSEIFAQNQS